MIPVCCDRPMAIAYYTATGKPSHFCPRCGNRRRAKKSQPDLEKSQPDSVAAPPPAPAAEPAPAVEPPPAPRRRGRPRQYAQEGDRQKAWKQRTRFERSEARRAYKREWDRHKRGKQS